ncbi:mitochondrial ubiquitin ligase activator of nfkb 1 [Galendromus occidentalis]|uniref:RING-type E3 ubiquitin transferase n=1 Tax=Galendromus occidentalis TaxID=34638 RepID=A0AAJ6VWU1_9ACAR|nr:mitochondrial ubiquitin ligase activator of nfkb 1 [Galendromus occidentalis]
MTIWNDLTDNFLTWDSACLLFSAGAFGYANKVYNDRYKSFLAVFTARQLEINDEIGKILQEDYPETGCVHAVVRGTVRATGPLLYARMARDEKGVLVRFKTIDYRMKWNPFSRMWHHEQKVIQDSFRHTPFGLAAIGNVKGRGFVDVPQPLEAGLDCLTKIYDKYTPASGGMSHLTGWLRGEHTEGVREKEYILKEGALVLGFGTLKADGTGTISLVPPADGTPMFLTADTLPVVVKTLDSKRAHARFWAFLFGFSCVALGAYVGYRLFNNYRRCRQQRTDSVRRDEVRRKRRQEARSLVETGPQCVVCMSNRVEVMLLECGHLCLCTDCCEQLVDGLCPICRTVYTRQVAAYLP